MGRVSFRLRRTSWESRLIWLRVPQHQALSVRALECQQCPIPVLLLARVVTKIKFGKIPVQVLLSDVVIDAVDSALQDSEIPFNGIRCDRKPVLMPHILSLSVWFT